MRYLKETEITPEGSSGKAKIYDNIDVIPGNSYDIIIGAGGAAVSLDSARYKINTYKYISDKVNSGELSYFGSYGTSDPITYQYIGNRYPKNVVDETTRNDAVLTGLTMNMYEKTLQLDRRNGALSIIQYCSDDSIVTIPSNPGSAGLIVIYY